MFESRTLQLLMALFLGATIVLSGTVLQGQKHKQKEKAAPEGTPVLWREPTDIASRDLFLSPGGDAMKPDLTNVTFVSNETRGYSKSYRESDGSGHVLEMKIIKEHQPYATAT